MQIISQSVQSILMEFGTALGVVNLMNLIPILCCVIGIQGREHYISEIVYIKSLNIGMCSDIYRLISFKLGVIMKITKLYTLI